MNTKLLVASLAASQTLVSAADIHLTQISTSFNSPIGIDYHQPTNSVITSVNYNSGGNPYNLERINLDGTHTQFSNVSGLTDELKIATVQPGNAGGFLTGELFTGSGVDGDIIKVSPNGSTVVNPWVSLPGAGNGLMRGSLFVDRTGLYGGDLIAATTAGEVWRVNSAGVPSMLADVDTHLEGLLTVPNDGAKYGPLAGKIIAGAENQGLLYAFDASGSFITYNLGVAIEDIDMIDANQNFFGVNFGSSRILGAPASDFTSMVGDILLTQENVPFGSSGLYDLRWNGTTLVADQLSVAPGSELPSQWEHITFAPAGIREIPQTTVPDGGSTITLAGLAMTTLLGLFHRFGRTGAHQPVA